MTVRKAQKLDTDQLCWLVEKFDEYNNSYAIFTKEYIPFSTYKNKTETFKRVVERWLHEPSYHLFIAQDNEKLIGYICATIHNRSERVLDKEGFIEDWFVLQEYRHVGVGKQLYTTLLNVFTQEQCNRFRLKAYNTNKETLRTYKKMGYIEVEISMVRHFP